MKKFIRGIVATIASLFLLGAFLAVILCIMECITSASASPLLWLLPAAAMAYTGSAIMKGVDRRLCNSMEEDKHDDEMV